MRSAYRTLIIRWISHLSAPFYFCDARSAPVMRYWGLWVLLMPPPAEAPAPASSCPVSCPSELPAPSHASSAGDVALRTASALAAAAGYMMDGGSCSGTMMAPSSSLEVQSLEQPVPLEVRLAPSLASSSGEAPAPMVPLEATTVAAVPAADVPAACAKPGQLLLEPEQRTHHLLKHCLSTDQKGEALAHFNTGDVKEAARDISRMGQRELQSKFRVRRHGGAGCRTGAGGGGGAEAVLEPAVWLGLPCASRDVT